MIVIIIIIMQFYGESGSLVSFCDAPGSASVQPLLHCGELTECASHGSTRRTQPQTQTLTLTTDTATDTNQDSDMDVDAEQNKNILTSSSSSSFFSSSYL